MIKGVSGLLSPIEVAEELKRLGLDPTSVIHIHRKDEHGNKIKLPLYLVILPRNEKSKEIYRLSNIGYVKCRIEPQRSKNQVRQCHKCQNFGHSQSTCFFNPRCVKCGENHLTIDCGKKREEPPRCSNCNGEHPASFRGCPAFPKPMRPRTNPENSASNSQPKPNPTRNRSYAQATSNSSIINPIEANLQSDKLTVQEKINYAIQQISIILNNLIQLQMKI